MSEAGLASVRQVVLIAGKLPALARPAGRRSWGIVARRAGRLAPHAAADQQQREQRQDEQQARGHGTRLEGRGGGDGATASKFNRSWGGHVHAAHGDKHPLQRSRPIPSR